MNEKSPMPSPRVRQMCRKAIDAACHDLSRVLSMTEDVCPDELSAGEIKMAELLENHPACKS